MQPNRHIDWFFSYPNFSHRMILSIVNRIYKHCAIVFIGCLVLGCSVPEQHDSVPINILILSGQNNHEWKKTTAALEKMYRNNFLLRRVAFQLPRAIAKQPHVRCIPR